MWRNTYVDIYETYKPQVQPHNIAKLQMSNGLDTGSECILQGPIENETHLVYVSVIAS